MKGIEGTTLGRYELRRRLAQGGMSEVYLAYDRRVKRQVAIKVLYGRDESFVRRFEREALAVGMLSHNHILPLYDFGEQRPWYYLVMPYIEGCNLREYLLKRKRLTLEEASSFIDQIASALQYAHDHGVVHRDVKPSNILLRPDGYAYLVDFGLAKALMESDALTGIGAMVGTPEYMAPEQSNGINDYRSDIYSLGVILYQMLTGRVPFTAETPVAISLKHIQTSPISPRSLNKDIPLSVEKVILKAMAKDPKDRFQEIEDFSAALRQTIRQEQPHAQIALVPENQEETQEEQGKEIEPLYGISDEITHVFQEEEQRMLHAPATPLLIPLSEKPDTFTASTSSQKRNTHWYRSKLFLVALICSILLILIMPLTYLLQTHQPEKNKIIQSPQTAINQQWNIDQTATTLAQAQLQATLAAQARVQATAGITSAIGAGNVLYAADMTSPGGGWVDDGSQCFFSPQGYHVLTYSAHTAAWCYSNQQQFSDAIITAQGTLLRGDIFGLIFRLNPTNREFYVLEINKEGSYRFVRANGSNPLNWLTLIDWTASTAIASGYGHLNTFLVIAAGSQFRFYINKQLIVTSFSDSLYASGLIGCFVGGDNASGTEAVFSNIWVFQK